MTRLRSLIKEVLSQPKKKDCGCGCNDCGGKAPILTEGKVKHLISEGLQYHMDKKIQLHESVYRIGSEKHFELIREARALWVRGIINVSEDDQAILETHLGHFGLYEGVEVPLDLPMVNEVEKDINQLKNLSNRKERYNYIKNFSKKKLIDIADELYLDYEEYDDIEDKVLNSFSESLNESYDYDEVAQSEFGMDYDQLGPGEKEWVRDEIDNMSMSEAYSGFLRNPEDPDSEKFEPTGAVAEFREELRALFGKFKGDLRNPEFIRGVAEIMVSWKALLRSQLDEKKKAKKKKKDPPIGKPKRGGPKAYYVYVRDPKTKRIKKVTFGSGGLRAKIRNPKARKAFAARHKCSQKNDRTKASYWSCRLPRYASALGLGANMNTFW